MGDSTAMTIQFLRARLLSERSVSRSARQRAEHLAQRVQDLEDRIKEVKDQRQQAEKAANEVLSILESRGMAADLTEVMDSCSDHDINDSQYNQKDEEASIEGAISPSRGGTLSWKSRSLSADSQKSKIEREPAKQGQKLNLFSRVGSASSRVHLGKSCRKIKNTAGMGVGKGQEVKTLSDSIDIFDGDEGMERAIERQDQLIDRFMAEENAQREWEQKLEDTDLHTENIDPEQSPLRSAASSSKDARECSEPETMARESLEIQPRRNPSSTKSEGAEKILSVLELARRSLQRELLRSGRPCHDEPPPIEIPFGASILFRLPLEINSASDGRGDDHGTQSDRFPR